MKDDRKGCVNDDSKVLTLRLLENDCVCQKQGNWKEWLVLPYPKKISSGWQLRILFWTCTFWDDSKTTVKNLRSQELYETRNKNWRWKIQQLPARRSGLEQRGWTVILKRWVCRSRAGWGRKRERIQSLHKQRKDAEVRRESERCSIMGAKEEKHWQQQLTFVNL